MRVSGCQSAFSDLQFCTSAAEKHGVGLSVFLSVFFDFSLVKVLRVRALAEAVAIGVQGKRQVFPTARN